jgi:hypothetical protein
MGKEQSLRILLLKRNINRSRSQKVNPYSKSVIVHSCYLNLTFEREFREVLDALIQDMNDY